MKPATLLTAATATLATGAVHILLPDLSLWRAVVGGSALCVALVLAAALAVAIIEERV